METREPTVLLLEGSRAGESSFLPALANADYEVKRFLTGKAALEWTKSGEPDLVVFDATAMRTSGARTCRRLRVALPSRPIIHCRAAGEPEEPEAGADVYLIMPFTARKLLNRVRDLLPADPSDDEVVRYGHLRLYLGKKAIDVNGQGDQRLTPKTVTLLKEFMRHPNQLLTRQHLMREVWDTDYVGDTRTLDVHIRWARERIEENPAKPRYLRTVRGSGFVLSMPESVDVPHSDS